jgi:pyruvate/2-oxoglutarate dehydrogenase complex dihydrolipoamide dehydrogenase (E3) component
MPPFHLLKLVARINPSVQVFRQSAHFSRCIMTSSTKSYDAIVIGSGQGGNPLAITLTKEGRKTAVIEASHVGGCCVNEGCTPTKTMIASGRVAYLARRAGKDYGVNVGSDVQIDMQKVRQRKRDIVTSFRGGGENRLKSAGVDVIMGSASFLSKDEVKVTLNEGGEQVCTAPLMFINVGERPVIPKIEGLEELMKDSPDRVLDSTSIQEVSEVPQSLIVLGGGYIGLEFGQLFSRLGAKVTVVQRANRLVPREDPEVTESLRKILVEDGMEVLLSTDAIKIKASTDGGIELGVRSADGEKSLSATKILLASGRRPNTDKLAVDKAGITTDKQGYVQTNDRLKTNVEGIYAMGDARGPPAFTHISYDDFRVLRDGSGLFQKQEGAGYRQSATIKDREGLIPYCLYTDPQLGHVGLHLHEIPQSERTDIQIASMPMEYVARALETDETRGMMKAVVNSKTGQILGFTCLGIEGGELMSVVQMAMMGGVKYWQLRDAVFAHPTIAESLNNLWGFLKDPE